MMRFLDGPRITRGHTSSSHLFGVESPVVARRLSIEVEVVVAADADYGINDLSRDVLTALERGVFPVSGSPETQHERSYPALPTELAAGWRFPPNSRKAHAFPEGEIVSLCRSWMFSGATVAPLDAPASPDDCARCKRLAQRAADKASANPEWSSR